MRVDLIREVVKCQEPVVGFENVAWELVSIHAELVLGVRGLKEDDAQSMHGTLGQQGLGLA